MKNYFGLSLTACAFSLFVACDFSEPLSDYQLEESYPKTSNTAEYDLKSGSTRTIQVSGSIDVTTGEIPPGSQIKLNLTGEGIIKGLGKIYLEMDKTVSVNQQTNEWDSHAEIILKTNNNSEIQLGYSHSEVDLSDSPLFHFSSVCNNISGTGRFSEINGFMVVKETINWATSIGTIEIEGEITL